MIDTSPLAGHTNVALSFSGGKDSLACVYLLRPYADHITIYHVDSGDMLPEVREIVDHVRGFWPRFVTIRPNVAGWIERNGLPTDLLPYTAHPIGRQIGESRTPLVTRYDCCFANLMKPVIDKITEDGITLLIRGTKAKDMKVLPAVSGHRHGDLELWLPIQNWDDADVLGYLRSVGAPICRTYEHGMTTAPDCSRCSAWWNEKRAAYLRKFHPVLASEYRDRLQRVAVEISGALGNMTRELSDVGT